MRVVVIGATGNVGTSLLRAIADGGVPDLEQEGIELEKG